MRLNHVALANGSEQKSDRFYLDLLGLKKSNAKKIPADLSLKIFGVNRELTAFDYYNDYVKFEVFICPECHRSPKELGHLCLEVDSRVETADRAKSLGLRVIKAPKGDNYVLFIRDGDGNLFEIKEKPA